METNPMSKIKSQFASLLTALAAALITLVPNVRATTYNWSFDSIDAENGLVNYAFANPFGFLLVPEHTVFYILLGWPCPVLDDLNNNTFDPNGSQVIGFVDWSSINEDTKKPIYSDVHKFNVKEIWTEGGIMGTILVVSTPPGAGTADWYVVPVASLHTPNGGSTHHIYGPNIPPDTFPSGSGLTVIPEPATGLLALAGMALLFRRKRR